MWLSGKRYLHSMPAGLGSMCSTAKIKQKKTKALINKKFAGTVEQFLKAAACALAVCSRNSCEQMLLITFRLVLQFSMPKAGRAACQHPAPGLGIRKPQQSGQVLTTTAANRHAFAKEPPSPVMCLGAKCLPRPQASVCQGQNNVHETS